MFPPGLGRRASPSPDGPHSLPLSARVSHSLSSPTFNEDFSDYKLSPSSSSSSVSPSPSPSVSPSPSATLGPGFVLSLPLSVSPPPASTSPSSSASSSSSHSVSPSRKRLSLKSLLIGRSTRDDTRAANRSRSPVGGQAESPASSARSTSPDTIFPMSMSPPPVPTQSSRPSRHRSKSLGKHSASYMRLYAKSGSTITAAPRDVRHPHLQSSSTTVVNPLQGLMSLENRQRRAFAERGQRAHDDTDTDTDTISVSTAGSSDPSSATRHQHSVVYAEAVELSLSANIHALDLSTTATTETAAQRTRQLLKEQHDEHEHEHEHDHDHDHEHDSNEAVARPRSLLVTDLLIDRGDPAVVGQVFVDTGMLSSAQTLGYQQLRGATASALVTCLAEQLRYQQQFVDNFLAGYRESMSGVFVLRVLSERFFYEPPESASAQQRQLHTKWQRQIQSRILSVVDRWLSLFGFDDFESSKPLLDAAQTFLHRVAALAIDKFGISDRAQQIHDFLRRQRSVGAMADHYAVVVEPAHSTLQLIAEHLSSCAAVAAAASASPTISPGASPSPSRRSAKSASRSATSKSTSPSSKRAKTLKPSSESSPLSESTPSSSSSSSSPLAISPSPSSSLTAVSNSPPTLSKSPSKSRSRVASKSSPTKSAPSLASLSLDTISREIVSCVGNCGAWESGELFSKLIDSGYLTPSAQPRSYCVRRFGQLESPASPSSVYAELLDGRPETLANELTALDVYLMRGVRVTDMNHCRWSKPSGPLQARGVLAVIRASTVLTYRLARELLSNVEQLVPRLCLLISACKVLRSMRNFNSLMTVHSVLQLTAVNRLKQAWSQIPDKLVARYQRVEALCSPVRNYYELRAYYKRTQHACLPYLGVFLRDLQVAQLGNAADLSEQLHGETVINVEALMLRGQTIASLVTMVRRYGDGGAGEKNTVIDVHELLSSVFCTTPVPRPSHGRPKLAARVFQERADFAAEEDHLHELSNKIQPVPHSEPPAAPLATAHDAGVGEKTPRRPKSPRLKMTMPLKSVSTITPRSMIE